MIVGRRARAVTVLVAAAVAACGGEGDGPAAGTESAAAEAPRAGGTAVLCAEAAPESLNPFVSPDQAAVDLSHLLFTPLVRYDGEGGFAPHLAERWTWNERSLTLHLRGEVRWHDGRPVTADDVAWTLRAAADPAYGYWGGAALETLESAVALDSFTVRADFTEPPPAGVEPLVRLPILPRHLLEDLDGEAFSRADYHRSPIGSGPYRLAERRQDGTLVFERAREVPAVLGPAHLDRIAYRAVPEGATLAAELRTGAVDACVTGSRLARRLSTIGGVEVRPLEPGGVQVLILNTGRPPFQDARVRRGLSAALEREHIAAAMGSLVRPSGNPLPESSPWHDPGIRQPDADPARAAAALDSAGWTRPSGEGVRRNGERELRFTLVAPAPLEDPLTVVQSQLGRVGIAVELRFMDWPSFVRTIQDPDGRPEAMALGFSPEFLIHPDPSDMLHSSGQSNLASYRSATADSLLEVLAASSDSARLAGAYRAIQALVARDVPMLYTVHVPRVLASGPRLRGVEPDVNGPFVSVASWWLAADR